MRDVRNLTLTACGGLYGLGVAIAASDLWSRPSSPHQLPGLLRSQGIGARVPFVDLVAVIVMVTAGCIAARALGQLLLGSSKDVWHLANGTLLLGAWSGIARPVQVASAFLPPTLLRLVNDEKSLTLTLATAAIGLLAVAIVRNRSLSFSSRDWCLLPLFFSALFALAELFPNASIQLLVVSGVGVTLLPRLFMPDTRTFRTRAFLIPCLTLPLFAFPTGSAITPIAILAILVVIPIAVTRFARSSPESKKPDRWPQYALAFAVYPLIAFSFPHAWSLTHAEGAPRVDTFEDGHFLLPASEMARGEVAFRDTIPQHGLLSDGAIEAIELRLGARSLGSLLRTRELVSSLNAVALYAVVFAATGSPHIAIAVFFATAAFLLQGAFFLRSTVSLFALACAAGAVRRRSLKLFSAAGALVPVGILMSPDFGIAALLTLIVACWAGSRGERLRSSGAAALGFAICGVIVGLTLITFRVPLVTSTMKDVLSAGPAYGMGRLALPATLPLSLPEVIVGFVSSAAFPFVSWFVVLIVSAMLLVAARFRRSLPLAIIGVWTVLAAVNYAQRHQLFFRLTLIAFLLTAATLLLRNRLPQLRWLGGFVALVTITAIQPTRFLTLVLIMRNARGPIDAVQPWNGTERSAGALFRTEDIPRLEVMKQAIGSLPPGETFFDFSNAPILFLLFDRDCPIRQTDVPFYETNRLQREVIELLERRRIGFVVTAFGRSTTIDGIPNQLRAPLVAAYIDQKFAPPVERDGVAIRFRKP